jgi:hypothetical protein
MPDLVYLLKDAKLVRHDHEVGGGASMAIVVKTYFTGTRIDLRRSFVDEMFTDDDQENEENVLLPEAFLTESNLAEEEKFQIRQLISACQDTGDPFRVFGKCVFNFILNSSTKKVTEFWTIATIKGIQAVNILNYR